MTEISTDPSTFPGLGLRVLPHLLEGRHGLMLSGKSSEMKFEAGEASTVMGEQQGSRWVFLWVAAVGIGGEWKVRGQKMIFKKCLVFWFIDSYDY